MKPYNLKTKIFLDSGNPEETQDILDKLGFLDGQTTNPSLIAGSTGAKDRLQAGNKFSREEVMEFYKDTVSKISALIPKGSVSIEVVADMNTTTNEMITQAKEMNTWIPNAHIKYPITKAGIKAAALSIREGIRVNMTLCFSQEQAAAVYAATKGAKAGDVFVSPFIGRLDDRQENGMNLIENISKMYEAGDGHTQVLAASIRSLDHLYYALALGVDIVTVPYRLLKDWAEQDTYIPDKDFDYPAGELLREISYSDVSLDMSWDNYSLSHPLTDIGLDKFNKDWNSIIK